MRKGKEGTTSVTRPNLECQDAYNAYNEMVEKESKLSHKEFTMTFVKSLFNRATSLEYGRTYPGKEKTGDEPQESRKRRYLNHKKPMLPACHHDCSPCDHVLTISKKRGHCKYCSYL